MAGGWSRRLNHAAPPGGSSYATLRAGAAGAAGALTLLLRAPAPDAGLAPHVAGSLVAAVGPARAFVHCPARPGGRHARVLVGGALRLGAVTLALRAPLDLREPAVPAASALAVAFEPTAGPAAGWGLSGYVDAAAAVAGLRARACWGPAALGVDVAQALGGDAAERRVTAGLDLQLPRGAGLLRVRAAVDGDGGPAAAAAAVAAALTLRRAPAALTLTATSRGELGVRVDLDGGSGSGGPGAEAAAAAPTAPAAKATAAPAAAAADGLGSQWAVLARRVLAA